ncbi:MAG: beta-ketoacyl synthase chain length factor [Spirochaetes bacterium]|nr:beta-ketoacyl synthase chain length factor [Spirochaetota bacterium]
MPENNFFYITDISVINSKIKTQNDYIELNEKGLFQNNQIWESNKITETIDELGSSLPPRLKNRMSLLSIGVCDVVDRGAGKNLKEEDELILFTCFGEIETTNKIIKNIIIDNFEHVSPTLFHNSVHHTSLGYYTILKGVNNWCTTISDGLKTNFSFINFLNNNLLLNQNFIVVHGDEYSDFNHLDKNIHLDLFPVFISYKVVVSNNGVGFKFINCFNSIDELLGDEKFKNTDNIFMDKINFLKFKKSGINKKFFTEYPLVLDNPCGIIYRIAMPFYLNIKGASLIIENINEKYYCYEVKL